MKKYLYLLMSCFCISMSLCLASCGSDDEPSDGNGNATNSKLIGEWEFVKGVTEYYTTIPEAQDYYNREEVEYGEGEYWEFTADKLIIHDPADALDGITQSYTFDEAKQEIRFSGINLPYKVVALTSNKLTLEANTTDGNFGMKFTQDFKRKK